MSQNNIHDTQGYELLSKATPRLYQSVIMKDVLKRIQHIITSHSYVPTSLSGSTPIYPKLTSALIEAATGSGKTSTVGFIIQELYNKKNALNDRLGENKQFPNLNILILNDRIGLVEQLRDELAHGSINHLSKTIKQPILSGEFIKHCDIKTYHSKADNDDTGYVYQGSSDIDVESEYRDQATESMHFATLQTAKTSQAHELIGQPNIIIVDEADIISMGGGYQHTTYMDTLMSYYLPDTYGNYPVILAMTATPDNITKDIFGEATSRFSLGEYLASERGPQVKMYIETPPLQDNMIISDILTQIQEVKLITDYDLKKQMINDIGDQINHLFPDRDTPEQKRAYLDRAVLSMATKIDDGDRCMIFAESIADADYISLQLNELLGGSVAVSRHSDNPDQVTQTMQNLKDGTVPIVVSVGQLIRGIDVPSVDKIFSLVNTSSPKKYLQLFGRGMRGTQVEFYDYGCSLQNLARAGDIYTEYKEYKESNPITPTEDLINSGEKERGETENDGDLDMYINDISYQSDSHQVNLMNVLSQYHNIEEQLVLTPQQIKGYFEGIGFENLMKYSAKDIKGMDIKGNKIESISTKSGYISTQGLNISYPSGFQEFICRIFDKNIDDYQLSKETIKGYFEGIGFENLMKYSKNDIGLIEIEGNMITAIATISGYVSRNKLRFQVISGFQEFICRIFDKDIDDYQLSKESIKEYFEGIGFENLMKYSKNDVGLIEIKDCKIINISTKSGFVSKKGLNIQNPSGFQEFVCRLFDKNIDDF